MTREIQRISFQEIRNPDPKINDMLHDLREDLVSYLISGLSETTDNVPETIITFWIEYRENYGVMQDAMRRTPVSSHHNTLVSAAKLEKLLMETFQLLMSSISVQDARMSIEQSQLSNQQALRGNSIDNSGIDICAFIFCDWVIWDEFEAAEWVGPLDLGVLRGYSHRDDCDSCYFSSIAGAFKE